MYHVQQEMQRGLLQMRRFATAFEKELELLPPGSLSVLQRNKKQYFYHNHRVDGKLQKRYLDVQKKRDRKLLAQLQRRRFLQKSLPLLNRNISALRQALQTFQPYDPDLICSELAPAYRGIQRDPSLWLPAEPDLRRWAKSRYHHYMGRSEHLIHETSTGLLVRSKAESMIADALTSYNIPFRYEQLLLVNEIHYAPDFTILHPLTRSLLYWEHLGKMDEPDYVLRNTEKIMDYRQAGIRVGVNLILTFEDGDQPLTMREIRDIIKAQILE